MLKISRTALLLLACAAVPLGGCATGGKSGKGDTQYVARDVSTLYTAGCALYPVRAWGSYGSAEFWSDREGRLLRRGVRTRWSVRDLQDTGKTETYPAPIIL